MKNFFQKFGMAFIFAFLGFLITYQIKVSYLSTKTEDNTVNKAEILKQNQNIQKQKEDYETKIKELMAKIAKYEGDLSNENDSTKNLVEELQNLKVLNGYTDVIGEGIILTIEPKKALFGTQGIGASVDSFDLLNIVNELYAIGSEVISINDIRLNSTTGIRKTADSIRINDNKIYPKTKIVIKAIGKKRDLEGAINFPGTIPDNLKNNFDIAWILKDDIIIEKDTSQTLNFKYAKPNREEK